MPGKQVYWENTERDKFPSSEAQKQKPQDTAARSKHTQTTRDWGRGRKVSGNIQTHMRHQWSTLKISLVLARKNHRLPKAAFSGLATKQSGSQKRNQQGRVVRRQAASWMSLETQLAGPGVLIRSLAPTHLASSSTAGHAGPLVCPGAPADWLARHGDPAHRLAHSRDATQGLTATGDKGDWPAVGGWARIRDTGGLSRAGHLSGAGDARIWLVTGGLACSGLASGPLTVFQEPGARLEGTGQVDAAQAVGILGRSRGNGGHWDSTVASSWPRKTVSRGTVVGHGARRAVGNSLQLASELWLSLQAPGLLYTLAGGWGPRPGLLGFFGAGQHASEQLVNPQVNCPLRSLQPHKVSLVVW